MDWLSTVTWTSGAGASWAAAARGLLPAPVSFLFLAKQAYRSGKGGRGHERGSTRVGSPAGTTRCARHQQGLKQALLALTTTKARPEHSPPPSPPSHRPKRRRSRRARTWRAPTWAGARRSGGSAPAGGRGRRRRRAGEAPARACQLPACSAGSSPRAELGQETRKQTNKQQAHPDDVVAAEHALHQHLEDVSHLQAAGQQKQGIPQKGPRCRRAVATSRGGG